MSLRYTHTLIAVPKDYVPQPARVQAFLEAVRAAGVVPAQQREIIIHKPSQRMREGRNPATGKIMRFPGVDRAVLNDVSELADAVRDVVEYRAEVSGTGVPELPPIPVDLEPPYYLGVACRVSPELRSTSDRHDDSDSDLSFDEPFAGQDRTGYFTHPYSVETIKVPEAGCARFWIEFELGNSVFPREASFGRASLDLLDPRVSAMARDAFGIAFVQGCSWG